MKTGTVLVVLMVILQKMNKLVQKLVLAQLFALVGVRAKMAHARKVRHARKSTLAQEG